MKQFIVLTTLFSVSMLAVWMVVQLFSASDAQKRNTTDQTLNIRRAVASIETKTVAPAPVYDASGRIVALSPNGSSVRPIILAPASNVKVAPVYDASGKLVSDPTGTIQ